jgi:hypothetical protein
MAKGKKKNQPNNKKNRLEKPQKEEKGNEKEMTVQIISTKQNNFKVKLPIRFTVIVLSVFSLSLFFEGWRQIQKGVTFSHIAVFAAGVLFTGFLLWLQGFWIYLEEKYKGTLRKKIEHFEKLEERWYKKRNNSERN